MITVSGPTAVSGGWNIIGVEDGEFILQGHLTTDQLKELKKEIEEVLRDHDKD